MSGDYILSRLLEISQKARVEGLWLYCQGEWYTPDEIEELWRSGRYRWGGANWHLRSPDDRRAEIEARLNAALSDLRDHDRRVKRSYLPGIRVIY